MLAVMEDHVTPGGAERFCLTLDTPRHHQKEGLLCGVDRAPSGHRPHVNGITDEVFVATELVIDPQDGELLDAACFPASPARKAANSA